MAAKIEKSTIIGDVLDIAPQTAPLFMEKMLDIFEDDDDVQNVWHNWEQD